MKEFKYDVLKEGAVTWRDVLWGGCVVLCGGVTCCGVGVLCCVEV